MLQHQSEMVMTLSREYEFPEDRNHEFIHVCKRLFNKWNKNHADYVDYIIGYTVILTVEQTLMIFRNPVRTFYFINSNEV